MTSRTSMKRLRAQLEMAERKVGELEAIIKELKAKNGPNECASCPENKDNDCPLIEECFRRRGLVNK